MKKIAFCLLVFGLTGVWVQASVAPLTAYRRPVTRVSTPLDAIKELDRMIDSYRIGKKLSEEDDRYNRELKSRILRGTFDLHELAKLSLNAHWEAITKIEQEHFVELLTQLLEERSVFAKEKAAEKGEEKSYQINYLGQQYQGPDKKEALAKTTIHLRKKGLKLTLDYKLRLTEYGWKIFDVIMDDASLVNNYRHSFGKIIKDSGYPELVHRMEKKLTQFREARS